MTAVARPSGLTRALADPALSATVLLLWTALALFVVYPLAMLFVRAFWADGAFSFAGVHAVLADRH